MTEKQKVERRRKYYRKNRKKFLKQAAAYRRKNRKKLLKQLAAYRRKNRKKFLKGRVAYYRKNRKKLLKQAAAYRRKNCKKISERRGVYYRKNRKKIMMYRRKNRKKILKWKATYHRRMEARHSQMLNRHKNQLAPRGAKGRPMSLEAHRKKLYYANGRERPCWYCSGENNKTGSGLDRLDNNITYTVKNTVPACRGCNSWRGSVHTVQETRNHFKPMRDAVKLNNSSKRFPR